MLHRNTGRPIPKREEEVLLLAAKGMTDKEIASQLSISPETVNTYWRRIRLRFGAVSRTEVVATAVRWQAEEEIEAHESEKQRLIFEINERQRTELLLRSSEERWRSLVDNAPDLILSVDDSGMILYSNRPYRVDELGSEPNLFALVSEPDRQRVREALARVLRERLEVTLEASLGQGEPHYHNLRLSYVRHTGRLKEAVVVATDVTDQHDRETALREALATREVLLQVLGKLTAAKSSEEVIAGLADNLRSILHFDGVGLFLEDPAAGELRSLLYVGPGGLSSQVFPLGSGISSVAIQTGSAVCLENAQNDPRSAYPAGTKPSQEHLVSVPLRIAGQGQGAITLSRTIDPKPFTQDDSKVVELFARILEMALKVVECSKSH